MKTVIQVPIEQELLGRIDGRAKSEAVSRAALIRKACAHYLKHAEREARDMVYAEGYRRVPEEVAEAEAAAWLTASGTPSEDWPEAPKKRA